MRSVRPRHVWQAMGAAIVRLVGCGNNTRKTRSPWSTVLPKDPPFVMTLLPFDPNNTTKSQQHNAPAAAARASFVARGKSKEGRTSSLAGHPTIFFFARLFINYVPVFALPFSPNHWCRATQMQLY